MLLVVMGLVLRRVATNDFGHVSPGLVLESGGGIDVRGL